MLKINPRPAARAYITAMSILMGASPRSSRRARAVMIGYVLYKGLPNVTWKLLSTRRAILQTASASCRISSIRSISSSLRS